MGDVDMVPAVVEALRAQAAARLRLGQGAPEPGRDYVVTGPEGGLLNANWTTPEMFFAVYARFIPNRTRRGGSAFADRMVATPALEAAAVLPK